MYDVLHPLAVTFKCQGAVDYASIALKSCSCDKVNLLDCHINATATGCDGRCLSPSKEDELSTLDATRLDLEGQYRTAQATISVYEQRTALLQSAVDSKAADINPEEASANIKSMARTTALLRSDLRHMGEALKTVYESLDALKLPTGQAKRCVPLLVHAPSRTVLECGCQGPAEQCRPDATRLKCTESCPADPPVDPKKGCYLRRDPKSAGRPGFDAEGNFCGGVCSEGGRTTTCMAVRNEKGIIRGCQCKAADVLLEDNDGQEVPDNYCLPEEYLGDFVSSCACKGSCRVGQNPYLAGQLDRGYDSEGLYCDGACVANCCGVEGGS